VGFYFQKGHTLFLAYDLNFMVHRFSVIRCYSNAIKDIKNLLISELLNKMGEASNRFMHVITEALARFP
jgi:hypothetical protein